LHYHSQFIHVSRLLVFVFDPSLTTWSGIPGYSNAGAAGGRRRARATASTQAVPEDIDRRWWRTGPAPST